MVSVLLDTYWGEYQKNVNREETEMERINDILYRMHKTSYYFMMGAFTSYGATALALGICLCVIFVTGAYTESLLLVIMGIFGPFVEARAIVEVYDEGRKLARRRRIRERRDSFRRSDFGRSDFRRKELYV